VNCAGTSPSAPNGAKTSFLILRRLPVGPVEEKWRAFLAESDYPSHYTAPEFFLEPGFRDKNPFAVLSIVGDDVTAVLTGINDRGHVQSGLSVRPQMALSHRADRVRGLANLQAGLLAEAESGSLVDLFAWSDAGETIDARFLQKAYEGVVMLDLSRGPEALFRKFSENKRTNIKKAIRYGVSVETAKSPDDIAAYYAIYVDWSRRKALPVVGIGEFQETFALSKNRVLFLARHEDKIIAGVVIRFFPGGIMEYAANSSLENALRVRPNDLLHWRAIEWGCAAGMMKYNLGGAHLFLRKFGGQLAPTTRHRLDLSPFRRYALGDWITDNVEALRPFIPAKVLTFGCSIRNRLQKLHT
jgi:Acetyltransferase (GNAT) domain